MPAYVVDMLWAIFRINGAKIFIPTTNFCSKYYLIISTSTLYVHQDYIYYIVIADDESIRQIYDFVLLHAIAIGYYVAFV